MIERELICHTPGCLNEGIVIVLEMDPAVAQFICGACSQPIVDARMVDSAPTPRSTLST